MGVFFLEGPPLWRLEGHQKDNHHFEGSHKQKKPPLRVTHKHKPSLRGVSEKKVAQADASLATTRGCQMAGARHRLVRSADALWRPATLFLGAHNFSSVDGHVSASGAGDCSCCCCRTLLFSGTPKVVWCEKDIVKKETMNPWFGRSPLKGSQDSKILMGGWGPEIYFFGFWLRRC